MAILLFIGLLAAAAVTPGQRTLATPPQPASPGMAYYLMRGNVVISPAYPDPATCASALAKLKNTMQPGVNLVVCAHRAP